MKQTMPAYEAYWLTTFKQVPNSNDWHPDVDEVIATAKSVGADGVDVKGVAAVVTNDFVQACRDAGLSTHVWTVDDPTLAQRFYERGVASVTTNYRDRMRPLRSDPSR